VKLTVPVLDDGVVALRPPEPGDVDAITAICQDRDIARFTLVPSPYARTDALTWLERSTENWRTGERASFVTVDAVTGEILGNIGVVRFDQAADVAEIGYLVKREARGRGVAPRALTLVSRWVVDELGIGRVELLIDVRNHASQRVAEKAGFVREREVDPPERCRERSDRMILFALSAEALTAQ
jgi:RimJ/RimL family protein N-acetyltransferase